jgi:ATP synthase protein I
VNDRPRFLRKAIRTVLRWQLAATAAVALVAGYWVGEHGALSAVLGGAVSLSAGWVSAMVAAIGKTQSAGGILVGALRAEAVKIGLMVILVGAVLTIYKDVVVIAFLGTFMATAAIFSMAFFVREYD